MDLFQKKNGNKFLTIDKGDSVLKKYNQVFSGIKCIEKISGNEFVYDKEYDKIMIVMIYFL